jgi:hypothetical protein
LKFKSALEVLSSFKAMIGYKVSGFFPQEIDQSIYMTLSGSIPLVKERTHGDAIPHENILAPILSLMPELKRAVQ